MNQDSKPVEDSFGSVLRSGLTWFFLVSSLGLMAWEIYLRYTEGSSSLYPVYGYFFVEHRAISMPVIVVAMITALLVDHIRGKRDPGRKLTLLSKVVALFAIALAGYISIQGI
ncbi:hypothetical protein ACEN8I_19970 [Polaromonas sp. CT11-55]|uniref:hypothetical protein n=1 Tax=Polaromonas sp. CT11-55 TaxID=3243045 RepID=UPI0039A6D936